MFTIITLELALVCMLIGLVQFLMTPKKVKLIGGDREPPAIVCLGAVLMFISFVSIALTAENKMNLEMDSYIAAAKIQYMETCQTNNVPDDCSILWKTKGANQAWGEYWSPKE